MTYNVAVWEGSSDLSDRAALDELARRYDESDVDPQPASPAIRRYVEALLARYPHLTELPDDTVDDSPWTDAPLINNATGSFFYFALTPSRADGMLAFLADTARAHNLVCFDPQEERLLTAPPRKSWRPWRR